MNTQPHIAVVSQRNTVYSIGFQQSRAFSIFEDSKTRDVPTFQFYMVYTTVYTYD